MVPRHPRPTPACRWVPAIAGLAIAVAPLPAQLLTAQGVVTQLSFAVTHHVPSGWYSLNGGLPPGAVLWWSQLPGGPFYFVPGFVRSGWHGLAFPASFAEASLTHLVDNGAFGDDLTIELRGLAQPAPTLFAAGPQATMDVSMLAAVDVLVASQQPATCGVQLEASVDTGPFGSGEAGSARVLVDLDDDGSWNQTATCSLYCTSSVTGVHVLELDPTPRRIRVQLAATMAAAASIPARANLILRISPRRAGLARFGASCAAIGWTAQLAADPDEAPRLGTTLALEVRELPAAGAPPTTGVLGFDATSFLGVPLPLDLGAFGMPGCTQYLSPAIFVPLAPQAGAAAWRLDIPASASLTGLEFFAQALLAAPGANAAGLVTTNALRGLVGI